MVANVEPDGRYLSAVYQMEAYAVHHCRVDFGFDFVVVAGNLHAFH